MFALTEGKEQQWPLRSAAKARSRQALLIAARELAAQAGYRKSSVDAVATQAGMTSGAIYSIFGGKRQLFTEALAGFQELPSLHEVGEPGMNMRDLLEAYGRHYADTMSGPLAAAAFDLTIEQIIHRRTNPDADNEQRERKAWEFERLAKELTEFAHAAREPLPLPADELALVIEESLGGLAMAKLQTGQPGAKLFGYVASALWRRD